MKILIPTMGRRRRRGAEEPGTPLGRTSSRKTFGPVTTSVESSEVKEGGRRERERQKRKVNADDSSLSREGLTSSVKVSFSRLQGPFCRVPQGYDGLGPVCLVVCIGEIYIIQSW